MQYSVAIAVFVIAALFISYRAFKYYLWTRELFIVTNDDYLRSIYEKYDTMFPYGDFRKSWISVSKNLNCPNGKMLSNCRLEDLKNKHPFPEMFYDDIFNGFEKNSKFEIGDNMLFSEFIYLLLSSGIKNTQS